MDLASLPDPLGYMLHVFAQDGATDPGGWISQVIGSLGSGAAVGAILWTLLQRAEKRHAEELDRSDRRHAEERATLLAELAEVRADKRKAEGRVYMLADRSTAVAGLASEVAVADVKDPELLSTMQRLEALLEQRGGE